MGTDAVVITLIVVEEPDREPHEARTVGLTVRHGDRVTVTLDRDTGQIGEVVITSLPTGQALIESEGA